VFLEFGPRATTSIHLHHCSTFSIQLSKNKKLVTQAVHFTLCTEACQGTLLPKHGRVFPKTACPHRTLARGHRQEARAPSNRRQDNKASDGSQAPITCIIKKDVPLRFTSVHAAPNHSDRPRPWHACRNNRWLRCGRVDIWAHVCHSCTRHDLFHTE